MEYMLFHVSAGEMKEHIRQNEDGTQDWTRSRDLSIDEGGKNQEAITWDDETGLFKNLKGKLRRDRK